MKSGIEVIAAERARQIGDEGWDAAHDAYHVNGELVVAAVRYAVEHTRRPTIRSLLRRVWPWNARWWKPDTSDPVRNLAKAGALIAAEIDRLQADPAAMAAAVKGLRVGGRSAFRSNGGRRERDLLRGVL